MRLRTFAWIALVTLGATGFALAQTLPPGMTMHRQRAGVLDPSGWVGAQSTEGAFSVKLPCLFNDFSMDLSGDTGSVAKAFVLGCLRADQRKFSATRFRYRNGGRDARSYFDKNATGADWPGATITRSTYQDMPVVDIKTENRAECGFLRFVLAGEDSLLLTATAPKGAACAGLDTESTRFFGSLVVEPRVVQPAARAP